MAHEAPGPGSRSFFEAHRAVIEPIFSQRPFLPAPIASSTGPGSLFGINGSAEVTGAAKAPERAAKDIPADRMGDRLPDY